MGKGILYLALMLTLLGTTFVLGVGAGMTTGGKRVAEEGKVCIPSASASASASPARSR